MKKILLFTALCGCVAIHVQAQNTETDSLKKLLATVGETPQRVRVLEGSGCLRLSLSYDIITKGHGGTLKVECREGEYTMFTIELPA